METTELLDREVTARAVTSDDLRARRGRVWKSPRPAGAIGAVLATTALIGMGGLALRQATEMPTPVVPPVDAADLPPGSMYHLVDQIGARSLWARGVTGAGVTVAVVDTGIAPVAGLRDQVVATVDLSGEYDDPASAFTDNHGHGTHLAGIIAGRDPGGPLTSSVDEPGRFLGVAPEANLVSIKVAGRDGSVTPASVIAGIEWAIAHQDQLGIEVLTLAFDAGATDTRQALALEAAVERAWSAGIVVVTAAGNAGVDAAGLNAPSSNPYVIAVGGAEIGATGPVTPTWTSRGDARRHADLAAPGASIHSLRVPDSLADIDHPEGYVDVRLFKGSGTSQSAAVVAGAVALMLDARPDLTPDQVKAALIETASPFGSAVDVGAGLLQVDRAAAVAIDADTARQTWPTVDVVGGPVDVPGAAIVMPGWSGSSWMGSSWMGSSWMGSSWMGSSWMGSSWMGSSWMGSSWMGRSSMGSSWMGSSWMGSSWMGSSWMGSSWMGSSWMGSSWMGSSWMGSSWMGSSWMGSSWMGSSWMGSSWMGSSWMGSSWMGSSWMGSSWM